LQLNKSDRNDALGLAQIVRTGWYREVAVKSFDSQVIRTLLTTRAQLVRMRTDLANQIRGVLKPFGLIAGKGGGRPFMERVRSLAADGPLEDAVEALLSAWQAIGAQIAGLDRRLLAMARRDQPVRRLMTAPGVGVLVAMTFVSVIDDPERFAKSSSIGAYWVDPAALSVRRSRPQRPHFQMRQFPVARLSVRGRRHHSESRLALVDSEGVGRSADEENRRQESHRRCGPQNGRHSAPDVARWQRVPLVQQARSKGMNAR
jgi:hypothetical protein